ncbi:MAG: class I SAM-dependent methyltransferase [Nitrospirota bacterium]
MNSRTIARTAIERKGAIQKITEFSPLISLLKKRKLRTIVEIGTAGGGTLYAWCRIAQPDALLVSIDLPGGPFGGGYPRSDIKKFRRYKKKAQRMYLLREDSHKTATQEKVKKILRDRSIDLLFLDGDHRYSGVKKDFRMYSPLVKKGGLVVLHDILFHPRVRACRVDRFWNEMKCCFRRREFIDREDDRGWGQWGGIGVLYL